MGNAKPLLFALTVLNFIPSSLAGGDYGRKPRNFIMVIPDGFGPASETMARDWVHWTDNATAGLPIDSLMIGQIRTRASDSYVTDSASSATAYSCGIKTFNGGIAVDDDREPCGTVLEAAKIRGFKTGLIVTSRITHATPAAYASHVHDRDLESNIAMQEIGQTHPLGSVVDLLMGGGRCFFTPKTTSGSCRKDDVDVLEIARRRGYTVFGDRAGFDAVTELPYLGLFTQDHMSYEIDRDPKKEPSLTEMAIKGLNDLYKATKDTEKGFFVMVEASRIDHAGHINDPTAHLHDILEYNRVMSAIRTWIDDHSKRSPTILISTADHECGGLTLGYQLSGPPDYWWSPGYFAKSSASSDALAKEWRSAPTPPSAQHLREKIFEKYGILRPTDAELARGIALKSDATAMTLFLASALSSRLGVGWASLGHSAVDVTLYGYGVNHREFSGQHENAEVAGFVARQLGLGLALEEVTKRIKGNRTFVEEHVKQKAPKRLKERDLVRHHG